MNATISPYAYPGIYRMQPAQKSPEAVIEAVCQHFGLTYDEIVRKCRQRRIVEARQIAIALIQENSPRLSLTDIGRIFRIDHTTVIHSLGKVKNMLQTEQPYREHYALCRAGIRATMKPT